MGSYVLSLKSERDIVNATKTSLGDFGERQTRIYMNGLRALFIDLAANPAVGKIYIHGKTGVNYRFKRYLSHAVYYRERKNDILILRILHRRMLPEKHL